MYVYAEHNWVELVELVPVAHHNCILVLWKTRHVAPLFVFADGVRVEKRVSIVMEAVWQQQQPLSVVGAHVRRRDNAVCHEPVHMFKLLQKHSAGGGGVYTMRRMSVAQCPA